MPTISGNTLDNGVLTVENFDSTGYYNRQDYDIIGEGLDSFVRTWVQTPSFYRKTSRRKSAGIDLPMNAFAFAKVGHKLRTGVEFHHVYNKTNGSWVASQRSGTYPGSLPAPYQDPDIFAQLNSKALYKLSGKFHDQSLNLGIAAGEAKQTKKLFADNIKQIAMSYRQLRRGDFQGAASILTGVSSSPKGGNSSFRRDLNKNASKALASRWLELQYGWKPLLSDIYGAFEFHANKLYRVPRFKETSTSFRGTEGPTTSTNYTDEVVNIRFGSTYTVKYVVYYSQGGSHDLSALGLINPAAVAWELVPYSFIVDWAIPIGSYLNSLDDTFGLVFVKGCKTTFWKGSVQLWTVGKNYTTPTTVVTNHRTVRESAESIVCIRSPLGSFPSVPPPSFKNPFGQFNSLRDPGDHALNALALLATSFGRGIPGLGLGR
jgi:hypothetical protein